MSIVSRDRLPPLRYSSSHSLHGLERVVPKRPPLTHSTFRGSLDKPLPPVPRKPSSVYSLQVEDIIDLYIDRDPKDERLPSRIFLSAVAFDSGYSENSEIEPTGSRLHSGYFSQNESDALAIKDWLQTIKSNTPKSTSNLELSNPLLQITSPQTGDSHTVASISRMDKQQPMDHRRPASARSVSPSSPSTFHNVQYEIEVNYPDTPISSRIIDVVDHSLVPSPLRSSQIGDDERPPSRLSRTSSVSATDISKIQDSIRRRLRKSGHVSTVSTEREEEEEDRRAMSVASAKYPHMNLPPPAWRERLNSAAGQRRASIQQSLSSVYETLTNFSINKPKVDKLSSVDNTAQRTGGRGPRTPAIPITPYQQMGPKAWESPPKSPRRRSDGKVRFPFLTRHHSSGRESERRREALKKQIVVVGIADRTTTRDGGGGHYI